MTKPLHNVIWKIAIVYVAVLIAHLDLYSESAISYYVIFEGKTAVTLDRQILNFNLQEEQDLIIECPDNISTYTDINKSSAYVSNGLNVKVVKGSMLELTWDMKGATEGNSNATGINQINNFVFNVGTTIITYTAKDKNNNIQTCSFTVTISDNQVPRIIKKPGDITLISTSDNCGLRVSWQEPVIKDNCATQEQLVITGTHNSGEIMPIGKTKVTYTITDGIETNKVMFSFYVTVLDKTAPKLTPPENIILKCNERIPTPHTTLQAFLNAGGLATDNCINPLSFKLISEDKQGRTCPYTIVRTYQIEDYSGNSSAVKQWIFVEAEVIDTTSENEINIVKDEETISLKSGLADYTAIQSGNWNDPNTWGGAVPTSADNVTIPSGITITVDAASVCADLIIESGGILNYSGGYTLQVYGNWTNNGTYNGGTNGGVEFTGTSDAVISGNTNFEELIISKGNLNVSLTINGTNTVASSGSLTLNGGLINIPAGGSFSVNRAAALTIPEEAGFNVNGGLLNTGNFTITNEGLIQVSSGTANFGTNAGNTVHTQVDGAFIVTGGAVNIAGRLENSASGSLSPPGVNSGISIAGGTVTLATVGNGLSNIGSLHVTPAGYFGFTGGTIIFQNPSNAVSELDLGLIAGTGTKNTDGGTFQFGNASTPAGSVFDVSSTVPLNRVTSSANADLSLGSDIKVNQLVLNSATTVNLNDYALQKEISGTGSFILRLDDGSGNPLPVTVNLTSGTIGANAYIEVLSTDSKHPNNANTTDYLTRYWEINTNDIFNPEYSLTLTYSTNDIVGTESNISMGGFSGGLPWTKFNPANTGSNIITATGITSTGIEFTGITRAPPTVVINNGVASESICSTGTGVVLTAVPTGDPGWTYSWDPATGLSASNISNPTANPSTTTTYTVTVIDGNGFSATDDIQVIVEPPPAATAGGNQTICINETATVSGAGASNGTIQWTENGAGSITSGANTLTPTYTPTTGDAGNTVTLTMTVTSNNACNPATAIATYTIDVDPLPTASAGGNQTICFNESATVSGASFSNGTIQWTENGAGSITTGGNTLTPTYTAAPGDAGNTVTLTLTVTSNNDCNPATATAEYSVLVRNEFFPPVVTENQTICYNTSPFSLVASAATGGSGPYTYQWQSSLNGSTWSNIPGATALLYSPPTLTSTTFYRIIVTDAGNPSCGSLPGNSVEIAVTPDFTANITATSISCNGGTSTVTITANGGTPPYSYTFNGITNSTGIFNNVVAGNNIAWSATDANSCGPVTGNIDILQPVAISITSAVVTTPVACNGGTATVTISATGGSGTLSYTFNGQTNTTGIFNNVYAGTGKSYSVTDGNDCGPVFGSVDVSEPPQITASAEVSTPVTCNGGTAIVTITASGGSGALSYTFNGNTNSTGVFTGVNAGNNLNWSVTDANNCGPVIGTINVIQPTALTASISENTSISCFGETAEIKITATGGTGAISYTFNGITNSTGVFTGINAGTYNWSVTDDNSCGPVGGTYDVIQPSDIVINSIGSNSAICAGSTLNLTSSATGGTGTLLYSWTGPNGFTASNSQNPNILNATPAASGTYTLTVIDANNCTAVASTDVTVYDTPGMNFPADQSVCHNSSTTAVNFSGADTYSWTNNNTSIGLAANGTGNIPSFTATNTSNVPVTATITVTPAANGCVGSPQTFTITVNPIPVASATPINSVFCEDGSINIALSSDVAGTTFTWTSNVTSGSVSGHSNGSGNSIAQNLVSNGGVVEYTITPSANGCAGSPIVATVEFVSENINEPLVIAGTSTPSPSTVCPGTAIQYDLESNNGSSYYIRFFWENDNPNVGLSSTGGPLNDNNDKDDPVYGTISFTATNTTNVAQTANISITSRAYVRTGGQAFLCDVQTQIMVLTVDPFVSTCPSGYTANTDAGLCAASIATADPIFECSSLAEVTWSMNGATNANSPVSGINYVGTYAFNAGTTTVTYNAEDINGNTTSCSFDVVVTDNQAPVLSGCPSDFNVSMDPGQCGTVITFAYPTANDNCDGAIAVSRTDGSGYNSGDLFPVGTTTISYSVSDSQGNSSSCSFDVTVAPDNEAPVISCVTNQNVCAGAGNPYTITGTTWNATATDNCAGAITLSYVLSGATTGNGTSLNNVNLNVGTTTVTWTATDINNNSSTCFFEVNVTQAPAFTTEPASQAVCLNGSVTFTANASGTPAPTYQWRKNGTNIPGETGTTLTINPVLAGDAANYDIVVTNSCGAVTSSPANLSVSTPPVITTQPNDQTDCFGESILFSVVASNGNTPYSYNWEIQRPSDGGFSDASSIPGISFPVDGQMLISNIGDVNNPTQTNYKVTVTDACGNSVESSIATITVNQMESQALVTETLCQGEAITFTVSTSGTSPVSYNWQKDGVPISDGGPYSGTTSQTLSITNAGLAEDGIYSAAATFNITQPNNNGSSTCQADFIQVGELIVDEGPAIVASIESQTICPGTAITQIDLSDANGNSGITWNWTRDNTTVLTGIPNSGSGTSISGTLNSLDPANLQTTTFTITASTVNGCIDTKQLTVTVGDNEAPTVICQNQTIQLDASGNASINAADIDNGSSDNCGIATITVSPNTFTCAEVGDNTVTLTVTDVNGNSGTCNATVTVVDIVDPVAGCGDITVQLDASGNASITPADIDNGSSDNCAIATMNVSPNTFTCANIGANTVTLTVTDTGGNTATCNATVTVEDNVAPVAECKNIIIPLDATGNATITAADIDNGSTDNCGIPTLSVSPGTFTCSNVGENTVTLTVTDANGNSATCNAIVTIEDNTAPTAVCRDFAVQLDASGNASILATDVDNGSSDNCGISTITVSPNTFTCAEVGDNTVTLTVTDVNGNTNTCNSTVTVEESIDPIAICNNITVQLDASGNASIAPADIDNGSYDNCAIATMSVSPNTFTCANIGANTVTLTVTDSGGNAASCDATVTVEDNVDPVVACQNFTVQLDASGNATITAADVDNGSTDNCGIPTLSVAPNSFTCANVGDNVVTLTASDANGNSATCTATVTVEDNTAPTVVCQDFNVELDASGNASISANDIDNGSTDNCGISTLTVSPNTFTCAELGTNTVTLTVTDVNGNSNTCNATVTVVDNIDPVAVCQDIVIQLDPTGNASIAEDAVNNGSSDACAITFDTDITNFTCNEVGDNTVVLTVTDASGNTATCSATVTVEDNVALTANCQDITVQLDAAGNATIAEDAVDNNSYAGCGGLTFDTDITTFDCTNLGANTVVLTVTDLSLNTESCTAVVTVEDNVAPVVICQDITVQLDAAGNVTIAEDAVNNGSSDACGGVLSFDTDLTSFTCANVGSNTVVLTVTDESGNSSTCSANVNVEDNINPTAICQNITIELDATGNASISEDAVDNGSGDNCGAVTFDTNINDFNCSNLGDNTVVLTVSDANGNTASCNAVVTVEDNQIPEISCPLDVNINVDPGSCSASGVALGIPTTTDNCGVASTINDAPAIYPIGTTNVTWTVTDNDGNTNTCVQTVTVTDNEDPVITSCPGDVSANNDPGTCSATGVDLGTPPTATDNCTILANMVISNDAPAAFPVGTTTVTWTVADESGNTTNCTQVVTVIDVEAPTVDCGPLDTIIRYSDPGECFYDAPSNDNDFKAFSWDDNCPGATAINDFDNTNSLAGKVFPVGEHLITWVATDVAGNVSVPCSFVLIIIDSERPVITNCPSGNILGQTDQADCTGEVTIPALDFTDNCPDPILNWQMGGATSDVGTGQIGTYRFNAGITQIFYTVEDANDSIAVCVFDVEVVDNIAPTAQCKDTIIQLNSQGEATILEDAVDNGSYDDCVGGVSYDTDKTRFYCTDLGDNTVTLTVSDGYGNLDQCTAVVTVQDVTPPEADCKNITVDLDSTGIVTIADDAVNGNSSDLCTEVSFATDITTFTCSDVGDNTVVLTVSDTSGNFSTCNAIVTVRDLIPPVIDCPNDTTVAPDPGSCTASLSFDVTASDLCSSNPAISYTDGFGNPITFPHSFAVGTTIVRATATDVYGNKSSCQFEVTVTDNEDPVITCPDTARGFVTFGTCEATVVALGNPVASDNCGTPTLSNNAPLSYPAGITLVTWIATDDNGNTASCEQVVVIEDNQAPQITCPSDTIINADAGLCDATGVTLTSASGTDNCSSVTITNDNLTGTFSLGQNIVVWTAADTSGNSETCQQLVTVVDNEEPTINCPDDTTVYADNNTCEATGVVLNIPQTDDNCGVASVSNDAPAGIPLGTNIITWTVTDDGGLTATCAQNVTVLDTTPPVPDIDSLPIRTGDVCVVTTVNPPIAFDNCGTVNVTTDSATTFTELGTYTILWVYEDGSGNTTEQWQTVNITSASPPVPLVQNLPTIRAQCDTTISVIPEASMCDTLTIAGTTSDPLTYSAQGTYTITWEYTYGSQTSTQPQTVIIEDTGDPVISCPADITQDVDPGICEATVNNLIATCTDICGDCFSITNDFADGPGTEDASGLYPVGTTTVTFIATDSVGNTSSCIVNVTIIDTIAPQISCSGDLVDYSNNNCSKSLVLPDPVLSDFCSDVTFSWTLSGATTGSGTGSMGTRTFNNGVTTVTYIASDEEGNTSSCGFTVSIEDTIPPVIGDCPVIVNTTTGPGNVDCSVAVNWEEPVAQDNCTTTGNLIVTRSHNSGDIFPVGTTTVIYTFSDEEGNTATCSFDVVVTDDTPPVKPILPPINAQCDTVPITPTTTDNCDGIIEGTTITNFPITEQGQTIITWVFTDSTDNYVEATQIVQIEDQEAPQWLDESFFSEALYIEACVESTLPSNTGTPLVADNCGGVELSYTDAETQGNCQFNKTISRTWTARDSSNNITTGVQTIYVSDNTDPILICNDTTVATANDIWDPFTLQGISYSDECGIDTVFLVDEWYVFNENVAGFCPDSVFREYTVWDRCGNISTCTFTISVNDLSDCGMCQDTVPHFYVDLDDHPDSTWILDEKFLTREGACCLFTDHNTAYGCISFDVYLDEDAVGLVMDIYSPAPPQGSEYYRIDCSDERYHLGEVICLTGGRYYTLTFCKPGEDKPWYEIRSIAGAVTADSLTTRADVDCFGELHVSGLEPSTIEWTVSYPLGADTLMRYLDLSDPENPIFTPDSVTPSLIKYQVCGTLAGSPECDGIPIYDCAEVIVNVLPPVKVHLNQDLTTICEDDIPPITASIPFKDPNLVYTYTWYDGPDGTGNIVGTDSIYQPNAVGTYSVYVQEITSGVGCNSDLFNFNIELDTIGPALLITPDTLYADCGSSLLESEIQNWIATAEAYISADYTQSVTVEHDFDFSAFDPSCGIVYPVHFWAYDECSNETRDSAFIIIEDDVPPVIGIEAIDQIVDCNVLDKNQHPDYLAWLESYGGAYASDDCEPDTSLIWAADTATAVWVGNGARDSITITFTVTDICGNSDQTTATFTIVDDQPPIIYCPGNFEDFISADSCSINSLALDSVLAEDICSVPTLEWVMTGATVISGTGQVIDEYFNVGITTVHYTAIDAAGLTDTCSFTVWVKHIDFPTANITCPPDSVWFPADPVSCVAAVTLDPVTWTDPCNEIDSSWNNSPYQTSPADASGSYPIGTTEFKWFVLDLSGNIDSTCTVKVVVGDVDDPQFTSCPDTIEGIIDPVLCEITNFPLQEPTWTESCGADLSWIITPVTSTTASGSGDGLVPLDYVFQPGQTRITYVLTDYSGNTDTCEFIFWPKHADFPTANLTCPVSLLTETVNPDSCGKYVALNPVTWTDPCNEIDSSWNNSPYQTTPADASGIYPIGTTEFKWFVLDISGNIDSSCIVTVNIIDLPPELVCPPDTSVWADFNETYASGVVVDLPYFLDNCDSTLIYTVTTPDGTTTLYNTSPDSINLLAGANTYDLGVTTIEYTFRDGHENQLVCDFTVTVIAAPDIECPPDTTVYLDGTEGICAATFDPGVPDLIEGVPPIDWTYTIHFADGTSTGPVTYTKDDPDKYPNPLGDIDFPLGVTTIEWRAENEAGFDTCSHWIEVIDTIPPTFVSSPYENCVDRLTSVIFDPNNPNPIINHIDPNLDKVPSPDYRTFEAGNTSLDLTDLEDNCCDSVDLTINWRIDFTDVPDPINPGIDISHPPISGTGQPSEYGSDILLWGDGVFFTTVTHYITYWVEDCNGNITDEITEEITITPRPRIIKVN